MINLNHIYNEDCRETMRRMDENSIDSIVTDPPYEYGFMGSKWDKTGIAFNVGMWRQCYCKLKPGGYLLSFGSTRTAHRMICAIEDAGFEIRDSIMWLYGCLSEDTEILTKYGWERFHISKLSSIFVSKEILIYDSETDTYKWELPSKWQHYNVKDTAYRIQSDNTDQIVSRNHRCLVERGGRLVFRKAEALQHKESVPVLESLPIVQSTLSSAVKGTGSAKQVLLPRVRQQNNRRSKQRKKAKATEVQYLRQSILPHVAKQKKAESVLFNGVQRKIKGLDKDLCRQRQGQKESTQGPENGKEPCMEWRFDLHETEGQVCQSINQICEVSEGVYSDVTQGRLCDGASSYGGEGDRQAVVENGVRTPHKPRCRGQQDEKPDAIQVQRRPQEARTRATYNTTLATVEPIEYTGIIFCPTVSTGAFVARRNGKIFLTGNSGFPKSLNIGKEVDKIQGNERIVVKNPLSSKQTGQDAGKGLSGSRNPNETISIGTSEYEGWGTALKPAHEIICVARKPIAEKTIAANVLKYGTGGINIDGCRIEGPEPHHNYGRASSETSFVGKGDASVTPNSGRFPANVILDEFTGQLLNEQAPDAGAFAPVKSGHSGESSGIYGDYATRGDDGDTFYDDKGGASRFFYIAKADSNERNEGLYQFENKRVSARKKADGAGGNNPRNRSNKNKNNFHPTVKPIKLIQYLQRLVTPKGGLTYDPFGGSGTSAIAAQNNNFNWILSELIKEHCDIAVKRIYNNGGLFL